MSTRAIGYMGQLRSGARRSTLTVRSGAGTTLGQLWILAALVTAATLGLAVVAASATASRTTATHAVGTQTEPLLTEAQSLYASLSDANATAATTFLTGGIEPPQRRTRYLADIDTASRQLALLTRQVGDSPTARAAVSTIARQLPVYTGLIETARTDNRQVLPIGAAYVRQASGLMTGQILPAANDLYGVESERLAADYSSGTSAAALTTVATAAAIALAVLVLSQLLIAVRTRRVFNVPMAAATGLVLVSSLWLLVAFGAEQRSLSRAQRDGSDPVEVFSAMRILSLRAEGDESLALIARGGGDQDNADFSAVEHAFNTLRSTEAGVLDSPEARINYSDFTSLMWLYGLDHNRNVVLEQNGKFSDAIANAVGARAVEAGDVQHMNNSALLLIAEAQSRFQGNANDASSDLQGLRIGVPLLLLIAAGLALAGFRQRIGEYR
jgi:hypothetical protein